MISQKKLFDTVKSVSINQYEFRQGVSFNNAAFEDDLDIKYTKVKGEFDIAKMTVANDIDSKYTKINGKGFSKYLLESKN